MMTTSEGWTPGRGITPSKDVINAPLSQNPPQRFYMENGTRLFLVHWVEEQFHLEVVAWGVTSRQIIFKSSNLQFSPARPGIGGSIWSDSLVSEDFLTVWVTTRQQAAYSGPPRAKRTVVFAVLPSSKLQKPEAKLDSSFRFETLGGFLSIKDGVVRTWIGHERKEEELGNIQTDNSNLSKGIRLLAVVAVGDQLTLLFEDGRFEFFER